MKNKNLSGLFCILLSAAMLFSLTACNGGKETETVGGVNASGSQQESTNDQATENGGNPGEPEGDPSGSQTEDKTQNDAVVATVEKTVMWDNEHIKVTALSLTSDQYYHILKLQIENKTAGDLYVMASRTAVNSFVVEPTMGVNVSANSTAEGDFRVRLSDVPAGVIADIETRFSYSSSDHAVNSKTQRVKIETSAAATHDYSYDESGTLLHDADGIKIICQGFSDEGNPMIYLSSTGELSEGCCVEAYEIYVNGKETYSNYYAWVFTNTRNVAEMELNDKDVDGNPLGEIESLQVSFRISRENLADSNPVKTALAEIPLK
ncbi:MAG: hypothetical protein IJ519_00945 [Clostridia bacterium]|nr:hypothetical protein [Clostridia bacterium]